MKAILAWLGVRGFNPKLRKAPQRLDDLRPDDEKGGSRYWPWRACPTERYRHFLIALGLCLFSAAVPCPAAKDLQNASTAPQAEENPEVMRLAVIDGNDIRFTHISTKQGLSQTRVPSAVKDDQGFMWFGTQYGLNRYDGNNFRLFVHDPRNPNSFSGVYITALFKDRDGRLWIGCEQFLERFEPRTESFTRYPIRGVSHISQDGAGLLWLATGTGLWSLNPATGQTRTYSHDPNEPLSLSSSEVKSSGEDREGQFWVVNSEGLDAFDRETGKVSLHIPLHEPLPEFSFYEDRHGVFWIIYPSGNGLAVFDRRTNTLTRYSIFDQQQPSNVLTGVMAVLEDRDGTLWFGTRGAGLLKFDREHQTFIRYRNNPADPEKSPRELHSQPLRGPRGRHLCWPGVTGSHPLQSEEPAVYESRSGRFGRYETGQCSIRGRWGNRMARYSRSAPQHRSQGALALLPEFRAGRSDRDSRRRLRRSLARHVQSGTRSL